MADPGSAVASPGWRWSLRHSKARRSCVVAMPADPMNCAPPSLVAHGLVGASHLMHCHAEPARPTRTSASLCFLIMHTDMQRIEGAVDEAGDCLLELSKHCAGWVFCCDMMYLQQLLGRESLQEDPSDLGRFLVVRHGDSQDSRGQACDRDDAVHPLAIWPRALCAKSAQGVKARFPRSGKHTRNVPSIDRERNSPCV